MKCPHTRSDITKLTARAAIPISAPFPGIRLPRNTMRKDDSAGIEGMSQAYRITGGLPGPGRGSAGRGSPFQQVDLVDVDGLPVTVDQDHDGQTDAHLGRGHGDDEQ